MSETDRRWFRQHPNANVRVRAAAPGETESLVSRLSPIADANLQGEFASTISPTMRWSVVVLKLQNGKCVRLLSIRDAADNDAHDGTVKFPVVCVGDQVAMEIDG